MKISDELLIQYLEGDCSEEQAAAIMAATESDENLKQRLSELEILIGGMQDSLELDPPTQLKWDFQSDLAEEISKQKKSWDTPWMKIAAGFTILIVGFGIGRSLDSESNQSNQLQALRNEVFGLQQVVMQRTLESASASERIQVVNQIESINLKPNEELIQTLVKTASSDKSPNVRYAAVQALGEFMEFEDVRLALVRSLENQTDALIQIAMINLLMEAEEKAAISSIKKILEKDGTSAEVKRQAEIAIEILI